jgi:hypothetical protein
MDNCSPHFTAVVIDLLSTERVRIVTFTPHTMPTFHVLDHDLFGFFKRRGQDQLPFPVDAGRTRLSKKKLYGDFRSTMTEIR